MNNPTKENLRKYLREKGLSEIATIDAIIKVATPNDVTLGGRQKLTLKPWDITKY